MAKDEKKAVDKNDKQENSEEQEKKLVAKHRNLFNYAKESRRK